MNLPFVPDYDGNDYKVAELREAISMLEDELSTRDRPETFSGLEDFRTSSSNPDARFPEDFQRYIVNGLRAYDEAAVEITGLSHMAGGRIVVRYDSIDESNLSFVTRHPGK